MAAAYSGLTTAQPVAVWSTRPSRKPGAKWAGSRPFLGFGDNFDLAACESHAMRAGLAVRALKALPGADTDDLGSALVQANQAPGVAGKVVRVERHLGLHLGRRLLEHGVEQLGLAAEVVIDLRFV